MQYVYWFTRETKYLCTQTRKNRLWSWVRLLSETSIKFPRLNHHQRHILHLPQNRNCKGCTMNEPLHCFLQDMISEKSEIVIVVDNASPNISRKRVNTTRTFCLDNSNRSYTSAQVATERDDCNEEVVPRSSGHGSRCKLSPGFVLEDGCNADKKQAS